MTRHLNICAYGDIFTQTASYVGKGEIGREANTAGQRLGLVGLLYALPSSFKVYIQEKQDGAECRKESLWQSCQCLSINNWGSAISG